MTYDRYATRILSQPAFEECSMRARLGAKTEIPVQRCSMNARTFVWRSIFVLLFWTGLSLPAMAQGFGAIGGTMMDASGAVLPGVTVTLSNPGTIGGNQQTVTDERGTYQFTRLVPGRYGVKADLAGFQPAVQEDVVVNADRTARVDLRLEVG